MQDNMVSKKYITSSNKKTIIMSKSVDLLKRFLNLLSYFFFTVLFLVAIVVSVVLIDRGINQFRSEKLPTIIDTYEIATPSMTPTIKVDDTVLIKRVDYKTLKKGDIITFKSSDSRLGGMIITHRINEVYKDKEGNVQFITKGDNNELNDDAPVLPQNIYGKVIAKIPFYSSLKRFITNPIIIALIVLLLFGIIRNRSKKRMIEAKNGEIEVLKFNEEAIEII